MYSLWVVQWDSTRRDHPGDPGRVSGSGPVMAPLQIFFKKVLIRDFESLTTLLACKDFPCHYCAIVPLR